MKKNLFTIIAVLVFVILLTGASFIFLKNKAQNNTTNNSKKFSNLNIKNENLNNNNLGYSDDYGDNYNEETDQQRNNPTLEDTVKKSKLQQITTVPIAGFNIVKDSDLGRNLIYYIRAGTGNVFYSDPNNNNFDNKLSNTTVKNTYGGTISNNGKYVAIQAKQNSTRELLIGKISTTTKSINFTLVAKGVTQVYAISDNDFVYTVKGNNGFMVRYYYPVSGTSETLVNVPFREAAVNFSNIKNIKDNYYIYTKASKYLDGVVYEVSNIDYKKRLPFSGQGLSAVGNKRFVIYSKFDNKDNFYKSFIYDSKTKRVSDLNFSVLPEKCITIKNELVCATSLNQNSANLPDSWYKGLESFSDKIISIGYENGVVIKNLLSPYEITGQKLDITNLTTDEDNRYLLFMDKKRNVLWQYNLGNEFTASPREERKIDDN